MCKKINYIIFLFYLFYLYVDTLFSGTDVCLDINGILILELPEFGPQSRHFCLK